ncbi:MAG: hypothetical protein JWN40_3029 [Phycisphaerales bacterium]|nr:hypothetical protein [Phycisphaerales bacterium]
MTDLLDQFHEHATRRPGAIALWHHHGSRASKATTFGELAREAQAFSAAIGTQAEGSAIIPMLLGKSADCVAAMLGALGAGKAFTCLNRKLRLPQISRIMESIGQTTALVDGPAVMTFRAARDGITSDSIQRTRWRVIRDEALQPAHETTIDALRKHLDIDYWQPASELNHPSASTASESSPGCCLFTSGSTGAPKGVLVSRRDLSDRVVAEARWYELTPADVLLNVLPFSFDVGLNQLLSALVSGCTVVLMDSFLPVDILKASAEFKVTGISAVPAVWADLLRSGLSFDVAKAHAALRYITVSGGDLTRQQLQQLPAAMPGVGIYKTYGQTETFRSASLHPSDFASASWSVGRPFGGSRIYVVRADRSPCAPNEEGEIVHTGLGTMLGYLGGQDVDDKLRPNPFRGAEDPADAAVFTGDMGYRDARGFLYLKGRRDGMLKVSGNRVYPAEIAEQVMATGMAVQAEVVGIKEADGDTRVVAFVVPLNTADLAAAAAQIRTALMSRLPSYMVPSQVIAMESIPRTENGKPDRPALMDRATKGVSATVI